MKFSRRAIIITMLALTAAGSLSAQIAANPVNTSGVKEWTVSASGTYFYQGIGTEKATATRFFIKSGWGVTPWLDLYLLGGVSNLVLSRRGSDTVTDYEDSYRFAYGAGFNGAVGKTLQLWFGGSAFRFSSQGNFTEPLLIGGQSYLKRFEMEYDWREFKAWLGIALYYNRFRFYAAGAGWYLWRLDDKYEYRDGANAVSYLGHESGEYLSGIYSGAIVGIEMSIPGRYTLTLEALLFNEANLQIMAGISQTGWQK